MKETVWLEGVTPIHQGVYRRLSPGGPYSCWSPEGWREDRDTPALAASAMRLSPHQRLPWRGLAEPSDLPCKTCRGHGVIDPGFDEDLIRDCIDCQ